MDGCCLTSLTRFRRPPDFGDDESFLKSAAKSLQLADTGKSSGNYRKSVYPASSTVLEKDHRNDREGKMGI